MQLSISVASLSQVLTYDEFSKLCEQNGCKVNIILGDTAIIDTLDPVNLYYLGANVGVALNIHTNQLLKQITHV